VSDPFKIDGPTCISFSGGRTSAYMLWRVLQSNGGLPDEAVVCFANTGLEDEATLRFVRECESQWGIPITWIEYRRDTPGFALVDYDSAARNGEPFDALNVAHRYLPNPMMRYCTRDLKTRPMRKYLKDKFAGVDGWTEFVGIRADEQRRVSRIRGRDKDGAAGYDTALPLASAGVAAADVKAFWSQQPFDLDLKSHNGVTWAGNCVLCFLKPAAQIQSLIAEDPSRATWWIKQEAWAETIKNDKNSLGVRFRFDRPSYTEMARFASDQGDMFDSNEEAIACFCGD
jgi:3'-phosphoadenosine 5'-phosphosulfate sulfotransferase (PAPS reductase)/FAD synthetase